MIKAILTIVVLIAVIGIGYWIFVGNNGEQEPRTQEVTFAGEYICLPHADTEGPQTLECALGLRADTGANYALDVSAADAGAAMDFSTGDRIEVTGTLVSREELNEDDRMLQYDIEGVIRVDSISGEEEGDAARHVVPGGALAFAVPNGFGLAVNEEQVLVESAVPPCAEGFDYCIYYNGSEYENTNFESAGLRIEERTDLTSPEACLTTPPAGYDTLTATTTEHDTYTIGTFSPIQSAATGQSSEGTLHRLAFGSTCYEFETRVGVSQFENFESGTIEEFTEADRQAIENRLSEVLQTVRFTANENEVIFGE